MNDLRQRIVTALEPREAHTFHGESAPWPQTNCALDLWIELVHRLGLPAEPLGAGAFASGFLGDAWLTLKPDLTQLRRVAGLDVVEMTPWRPLVEHVVDHLAAGRLVSFETDGWWLPDTAGTSYRADHVKTSITPLSCDPEARTMTYVHNAGLYSLEGEDFTGVLSDDAAVTMVPLPYIELVRLVSEPTPDPYAAGLAELRTALALRPAGDQVAEMSQFLAAELPRLAEGDPERFHDLAFVTTRQFGACAQIAGRFAAWLGRGELDEAAARLESAAESAKAAQFVMARVSRGRRGDVAASLAPAGLAWQEGVDAVAAWAAAQP
ncbi:DUF1839 family protein [Actinomycetota bacterium]